jgi:hypothetical protein
MPVVWVLLRGGLTMSKLATPISSSARGWRVAFPAIAAIVAVGHFGCQRQFSPPPSPGGQGTGAGSYSNGGTTGPSGAGGYSGGGVGGYYGDGGIRGAGGNYGGGGYYGLGGNRGGVPCLGPSPACWPINAYCVNNQYPAICDTTTGLWGCPSGFTTFRPPMNNCGDAGAGGMQCEMLPILGSGGATGAGGAVRGVGGAREGDAGVGSGGVGDAGVGGAGIGDAGVGDAGTGGAPAGHALSFASAKSYATRGRPAGVVVADMNGDGHLDIVVTSQSNGASASMWQVNVLLNVGDGTFGAPTSYALTDLDPPYLAVGDLDGDGKPDVALTIVSGSASFSVDLFLNQGDGTLAAPSSNYVVGSPQGLVLADVNGDGQNDLVAALNSYSPNPGVAVLLNRGGGAFAAARTFSAGAYPSGVVAGDLDHDGRIDLAVISSGNEDGATGNLSVLMNQGGGSFAPAVTYHAGDDLVSVAEADLNGDGQPDLAVLDASSKMGVLFNRGTGSFVGPLSYGAQHPTEHFALGDVSGDGRIDIVSAAPLQYGGSDWLFGDVSVMVNLGDAIFDQPKDFADEPIDGAIALGDFNGDGKLDVVAVNHTYNCNDSVSVLLNASR